MRNNDYKVSKLDFYFKFLRMILPNQDHLCALI